MIIHTIGGQASIMGKEREFLYDGATRELRVKDVSFDEATAFIQWLEKQGPIPIAARDNSTIPAPPPSVSTAPPAVAANGVTGAGVVDKLNAAVANGKAPGLVVDKGKIAALAQSNPQKPKKEKPEKAKKEAASTDDATAAAAPAEPEEDDGNNYVKNEHGVLVPKNHEAVVAAKHGKDAPVAEDVEAEEPTPKAPAPAVDVPPDLVQARKLRDVLAYLIHTEGISKQDTDALKKRCEALKPGVACLQRIDGLDARIDRTLEVMDVSEDVT